MATLFATEQLPNINPYGAVPSISPIPSIYTTGLTTMVAVLATTPGPTIPNLNTALIGYIGPLFYPATPTEDQSFKLGSIMSNVYNAYIQPGHTFRVFYSPAQLALIDHVFS